MTQNLLAMMRAVGDGGGQKCEYLNKGADEIERLQALLDGDFKKSAELSIKAMQFPDENGGMRFDLQASIIPLIAEHLAQIFKMEGGENYLGIEFIHPELGPMTLNIQRRFGETPAAQNVRLKADLSEARGIIESLTLHATHGLAPHYSGSIDRAENDDLIVRARAFLDRTGK
jgi:hypothetical protein